jgi:hypothetical protein
MHLSGSTATLCAFPYFAYKDVTVKTQHSLSIVAFLVRHSHSTVSRLLAIASPNTFDLNSDDYCYPPNDYMAKLLPVTTKTKKETTKQIRGLSA